MRRQGWRWNHNEVTPRVVHPELNKDEKAKDLCQTIWLALLVVPEAMNECWLADFMSDGLWNHYRYRSSIARQFQS